MNIQLNENLLGKLTIKATSPFNKKNYRIFYKNKTSHYRSGKSRQFEKELKKETLVKLNTKLYKILEYWNFAI